MAIYSKSFSLAVNKSILKEDGYVNDPDDPGGETKWGITKRTYPDLDIKNLTKEQATAIYHRDYWCPLHLDRVNDNQVAAEIFDTAIMSSCRTAVLIAQRALNYLNESLDEDGDIGPLTLDAINRWCRKDSVALYKCLNGEQYIHLKQCKSKYHWGWTKRLGHYWQRWRGKQ